MKAKKITDADATPLRIYNLPNRPTAPKEYGGAGLTTQQLKSYFDSFPELLRKRFNYLLDDLAAEGEDSVIRVIKSGFEEGVTLYDFIQSFRDGRILSLIPIGGTSVYGELSRMRSELNSCLERLEELEEKNG